MFEHIFPSLESCIIVYLCMQLRWRISNFSHQVEDIIPLSVTNKTSHYHSSCSSFIDNLPFSLLAVNIFFLFCSFTKMRLGWSLQLSILIGTWSVLSIWRLIWHITLNQDNLKLGIVLPFLCLRTPVGYLEPLSLVSVYLNGV